MAGVAPAPIADPIHLFRPGEIALVLLFGYPAGLSGSLGCFAAFRFATVLLLFDVTMVGKKKLPAMTTFSFTFSLFHRAPFLFEKMTGKRK
jgi:hypothetical protein